MRILVLATCLSMSLASRASDEKAIGPLPEAKELRSLKVVYSDYETHEDATFEVAREYRTPILAALSPAKRDDHPAKWEVLGAMVLVTTKGKSIVVNLFSVGEGAGAFSIANADPNLRIYYRGGKSADLVKALRAARAKAGDVKKSTQP